MIRRWHLNSRVWVVVSLLSVLAAGVAGIIAQNGATGIHRVVFQINSDDQGPMKHAVSNSINLVTQYREKHESIQVEIVAYGRGIDMFRSDSSPLKDVLAYMHLNIPEISFTVCGNTKSIMEEHEHHALSFIDGTRVVPFGIARLIELQEAGWSYIRP